VRKVFPLNLYFWLFALYALLITPVGAQVHIRIDHGLHYRFRLRAAGLPVLRKKKEEKEPQETHLRSGDVMKGMKDWDYGMFAVLMRQGHFGRILRLFEWRDLEVRARISFEDAALTAMVYTLIRTVLQTAAHIRPLPVKGRVEMDFQGEGTQLSLRCIATARLGNITAAAIRLWLAAASYRAKGSAAEEETYAAASH